MIFPMKAYEVSINSPCLDGCSSWMQANVSPKKSKSYEAKKSHEMVLVYSFFAMSHSESV